MIYIEIPNDVTTAKKTAASWLKSFPAVFAMTPMSRRGKIHAVLLNEENQLPELPPDGHARFSDGRVKYGKIRPATNQAR